MVYGLLGEGDHTVDTDFVVGGIESEIEDLGKEASTPFVELGIELFGEDENLAGRDSEAAEFFHDFSDAPRANNFDIQGGDGGFERPFAAGSLLEKGGAEGASLSRTWVTASWSLPMAVWKLRGLKPLA